jgi:hypothetical protein
MPLVGRGLRVVLLLACLGLIPARAEAGLITLNPGAPDSSGTFTFSGIFSADNDVAVIYLNLLGDAVLSAGLTSHLETPAGFDPILTLFGEVAGGSGFLGTYEWLAEGGFGFLDPLTLTAGNYVLAVTQYSNLYNFAGGFEYDAAPNGLFTRDLFGDLDFDGNPDVPCAAFVAFDGGCRTPAFAGTVTIEPENVPQPVPEPGSLTLLALGGAALLARRTRRTRAAPPASLER